MAGEWRVARIEEVAERVAMGPFGSSIKVETFVSEGVPVISGQHLHGSRVDDKSSFNFITQEHAEKLRNANVQCGDVIFTHAGNIGQVAYIPPTSVYKRYVISQRQFYLRPDFTKVLPEFLVAYFRSPEGRHKLLANTSQVGVPSIAQPVTYLRSLEIPLPPLPEQRAIAGFLDEKCAKVDEAVRIKEEQIALLRERRQILIQQAVTRGLNPAAPMKDSGIDWIGQIPAHWEVVPLRRVSRIHAGNGFPVELQGDQDGTIPFMKVSDFSSTSILIASSNNYVSEKTIRSRKWNTVPRGSIVTAKIGEALRKNHRNILGVDAIIDNNCVGFEAVGISQSYFFWLHKVIDFDWFVNPGAVPSISMQKYKGEKVPNPPISEQIAIVEHIEAGCAMVDKGIAIKEDQIAALKEYKTSLINAAVTGKIKVA